MAKQTFTTGQVLTAAQMTSLQQTAMGGGAPVTKTASYVLVAADAGTVIQMNSASSTTITVNTGLFAAGDSVQIQNIGAGICTITAGTATVTTAGSLALSQWEGGSLYFTSTSAAIFFDIIQSGASGKVFQVVNSTTSTQMTTTSTTMADTNITATITPTLSTSKILILITYVFDITVVSAYAGIAARIMRGATEIWTSTGYSGSASMIYVQANSGQTIINRQTKTLTYLDAPATTSSTTYKLQGAIETNSVSAKWQPSTTTSSITLLEIGA